ncbi:hypothetical protein GOBAR_AA18739 [Gossypium barbadense]|uniref:Uncharacterized protein n=1 Tax=Gossypium barbadense TaxID=3634 RepID=A0A2P5XF41_GOSBA|nr:hypothetical protein GOBAR_AA18739 [Gossypium barbadense]
MVVGARRNDSGGLMGQLGDDGGSGRWFDGVCAYKKRSKGKKKGKGEGVRGTKGEESMERRVSVWWLKEMGEGVAHDRFRYDRGSGEARERVVVVCGLKEKSGR